ncbi:MAG: GEVED domain-containing protein [Saprospiraceae bacterium]
MRKNSIFFLLFIFIILSASVIFHINDSLPKKSNTSSAGQLTCAELDSIESSKLAWGDRITHHPFYTRPHKSKEEWEETPAQDRPDLAFELDFMKTMDPALGAVPYERLFKANMDLQRAMKQRAPISGVSWKERGPYNVGGRTRAIMFDPNDATHKKVWAGGVGGGLWFTNDVTIADPVWNKVNDFWDNIAVTTLAYNPANTQELYAGTGEGWMNGGSQDGSGIWKSSNGGGSWTLLASTAPGAFNSSSDFHNIQKIVVKADGTVYAATRGYFINAGGIMRSTNGGTNWTKVLTVYTGSGSLYDWAADVEIAANGDVYASFGMGSDGRLYKTRNASNGAVWRNISTNINVTGVQRIEIACAPSNFLVLYAVSANGATPNDIQWLKMSTDSGQTWTTKTIPKIVDDNTTHFTVGQGWYDLIMAVHPTNSNVVLAGGRDLFRTTDGGTSWTGISHWYGGFSKPYVHADQHVIAFRPTLPNEVVFGNDAGVFYSSNAGNTGATPSFDDQNKGFNVTQFYSCATRNEYNSNYFLGGAQDNGTIQLRIPQGQSTDVTGGDGAFCFVDQVDPDNQLAAYTYNYIFRSLDNGYSFGLIVNNTISGLFINPGDYDNTRKILYASGGNDTIKRYSGIDALAIPPTTNLLFSIGGTKASAFKVSPFNDVLFFGTASGRVYKVVSASTGAPTLTRIDNGATPITTVGWISNIDTGEDDNHLLVSFSNYGVISLWETSDGGGHWYNKEGNLPDIPVRWAIYNPDNRNQVLAATEIGVYSSDNFAHNTVTAPVWGTSNIGLANTRCDMLKYRSSDKMVLVGTHGRGLFTTDIFSAGVVADFTSDVTTTCSGSLTVHFYDASIHPNGTWAWDVDNNGTTDYTTQNPTHTYNTPGTYSVKLTVNSGATEITKYNFINVISTGPVANTGCTISPNSNTTSMAFIGIHRFALGTIDRVSPPDDGDYHDYTCGNATSLDMNTLYNVTVQTGVYNPEGANFFIDYNNNGNLEAGESVGTFPVNTNGTRTISFTTPSSPNVVTHKNLRARILSRLNNIPADACNVGTYGQAEDYTVYFNCTLLVTQTSGSAPGSINAAIACANPGDTIRISAALAGQTVLFGGSVVALNKNLTFIGLGANTNLTWSGPTGYFNIIAGTNIEFKDLTITAGANASTGAFFNSGNLILNHATIHRGSGPGTAILLRNQPGSSATMVNMTSVWN